MTNDLARPALRVRGRSFIALALAPEPPVAEWLRALDAQVARAPGFFAGKPVVLDLSAATLHGPGLRAFLAEMRDRGIRVLGLEGIGAEQLGERLAEFPPILSGGRPGGVVDVPGDRAARDADNLAARDASNRAAREAQDDTAARLAALEADAREPNTLLIREPVRSGQSIHFLRGDVTIVGSVSSGAEVIAGGSIHVYGALRGRAFAGIAGDGNARIFCRRMEAELLAIAGSYATSDGLEPALRGRPAQAWFDGQGLSISAMD